ncbi:MAG: DNA-binding NtrC family response regulator [Planctomycetota bacterium]|jgi:DNA-binding NtrC family response regulator
MSGATQDSRPGEASYVVGHGGPFADFEAQLRRVAGSPATVLLEGESGSGKSRAARRIHQLSPRNEGFFVEVAISALPADLLDAELFGHEEGAFTGAHEARPGRFRRAEGGTILLDGVEDLAPNLQVKLLRVLQERVVEPLGGQPEEIDVRIVATVGLDLEARVAAGAFRQDLYYRLAVVTLRVPPLRARLMEFDKIVDSLLNSIVERVRVPRREVSTLAQERLERHGWPGNLRELENALERVLVLGVDNDSPIAPEEFDFLDEGLADEARLLASKALAQGLTVEQIELAMIEEAMIEQRGNLSAAARQVGLSRRALEYRRRRSNEEGGACEE